LELELKRGRIMGVVIYRRITNILEVPSDVLVRFAGKGLFPRIRENLFQEGEERVNALAEGEPLSPLVVDVGLGDGLVFNDDGTITLDLGDGISLTEDGRLRIDLGDALQFDENGHVTLKLGAGLEIDENNAVAVTDCDKTPDPSQTKTIKVQTDSKLHLEGNKLMLDKTYQTYSILRNAAGALLDVVLGEVVTEKDEVMLGVCYGYGYGQKTLSHTRRSTPDTPNFYQK
jgi:hypothetical protein